MATLYRKKRLPRGAEQRCQAFGNAAFLGAFGFVQLRTDEGWGSSHGYIIVILGSAVRVLSTDGKPITDVIQMPERRPYGFDTKPYDRAIQI